MASPFTLCLSLLSPQKQHNNLLVLQPLSLWRLVTAKYLPTNYPQIPFLSLQPGPHKRDQTITAVKAPRRKETHNNRSRHEKEGCGKISYWWRRNWTWLKSKQNKPPTKHKHSAHFVNGPARSEYVATRALPRRRDEKDKCLKGELFLCLADIFTQLCAGSKAVQPAFLLLDKSQEVLVFFSLSLTSLFTLVSSWLNESLWHRSAG